MDEKGGRGESRIACAQGSRPRMRPLIGIHYVNITSSVPYPVIKRLAPLLLAGHPPERGAGKLAGPRCVIRRASGDRVGRPSNTGSKAH